MAIIGYARTSTREQTAGFEAQQAELAARGCTKIFAEQLTGMDAKRPQLMAALDYVREGDVFVVTKPDRLARSTMDLLEIARQLEAKAVTLRILSMDVDTSTATGKLMLTMLAGIAEFERALMLERQKDGIAKAKADGKYQGRAPTAQRRAGEVKALKAEGKTLAQIVAATGISQSSVQRILRAA